MIPHTEGIVLKSFDFRETSRIATFFTKDYGKITGVLKGIRKDYRKFRSTVDKFTLNDIVYYHYQRSDLHLISQCDLKEDFSLIRGSYKKSMAANYSLELVNFIMPPEQNNQDIYRLMLDYLNSLKETSDIDKLIYIFQIKVLLYSGFRPHIDACVKCARKVSGRARFSLKAGGLLCPFCPVTDTTITSISSGTIASILYIEKNKWPLCLKLNPSASIRRELKYTLNNFLVYHLEKYIKTARYL